VKPRFESGVSDQYSSRCTVGVLERQ
jgi:hypothetical protein